MAEKRIAASDAGTMDAASNSAGFGDVINSLGRVTQALADTVSRLEQVAITLTPPTTGSGAGPALPTPLALQVNTWEDDPLSEAHPTVNPPLAQPVAVPVPTPTPAPLNFTISGQQPPAGLYAPNTANFRYWGAFEALARGIRFWTPLLPPGTRWSTLVPVLNVGLDTGTDFNAFYARNQGLRFFHGVIPGRNITVFSADSPNVVQHEMGHAILDALKPQLFNTAAIETAAFHESFGDMSAMLCALQLSSLRTKVITETQGHLSANSRLSRLAEQLGWAIRQFSPTSVEADSLRNAANHFRYANPATVPPTGPATMVTQEPHSFSRIFTGAFLDALAGVVSTLGGANDANLQAASRTLGQLLIDGVRAASVVPAFYSQVAAGMIQADRARNAGRFVNALTFAFVNHGILAPAGPVALMALEEPPLVAAATATDTFLNSLGVIGGGSDAGGMLSFPGQADDEGYRLVGGQTPEQPVLTIAAPFTGGTNVKVFAPDDGMTALFASVFATSSSAVPDDGPSPRPAADEAELFLKSLIEQGQVKIPDSAGPLSILNAPTSREKSHELVPDSDGSVLLVRRHFDCGFCGSRH